MLRRPTSLLASRLQPSIISLRQRSIIALNGPASQLMRASTGSMMGQRRLLSSASHNHAEDLKHFEVHGPEDVSIMLIFMDH